MYTVHEVAKLAHTTVKTLHHYHKIGLLIPERTTDAGYRLYGKKDLERLQHILFYKELDFPLRDIQPLLDGEIDREATLIRQKRLIERKIARLRGLIGTIQSSIQNAKEGVDPDMDSLFKGFETEEEWREALRDQNDHLQKEYGFDLTDRAIDVDAMNEAAMEAKAFNEAMISFLQAGFPANDPQVFERVRKHLAYTEKKGHPSTPEDFRKQTEFFLADDFHRNMLEQWQVGYAYYLNRAAADYSANGKSAADPD